jgi:hypothetical protein
VQEYFQSVIQSNRYTDIANPSQTSLPDPALQDKDLNVDLLAMDQYVDFDSENSSIFSNLEIESAKRLIQG